MKYLQTVLVLLGLLPVLCVDSSAQVMLEDGAISYVDRLGQRRLIGIAKKCADLWVSPDESLIAFIVVEQSSAAVSRGRGEELIERSSVYIAWSADGYAPVRILDHAVSVDHRLWRLFRNPRLSADLAVLYFDIPYTMTTSKLFRVDVSGTGLTELGDETNYCVIWGGESAGDLLVQNRRVSTDPSRGIEYQCYIQHSGLRVSAAKECDDFREFADQWGETHRDSCR